LLIEERREEIGKAGGVSGVKVVVFSVV